MKILVLMAVCASLYGASCPAANGFANCQSLKLNHTLVPGNLTNYPALVCFDPSMGANCLGNGKQLATTSNGGFLKDTTNGFDFIFTSDSGGTMALAYEAKFHNLATGAAEIWVNLPTVSSSVDTSIYMFYGKATVTTDQSNVSGTWDANFLIVYHFDNITSNPTTTINDTKGNFSLPSMQLFNNSTRGSAGTGITGVAGAANLFFSNGQGGFSGADGTYSGFPTGANAKTLECWANTDTGGPLTDRVAFSWGGTGAGVGFELDLFANAGSNYWGIGSSNANPAFAGRLVGSAANDNKFHHIAATVPSGSSTFNDIKVYIDGTSGANDFTLNGTTALASTSANFHMACGVQCNQDWFPTNLHNTYLDECRVSNIERSANWLATEYNNVSNAKSFWSTSSPGGATGRTIIVN